MQYYRASKKENSSPDLSALQHLHRSWEASTDLENAPPLSYFSLNAGTAVAAVQRLLDAPVALATFFADTLSPRIPILAVASGHVVYMYRHLRPYKKFVCPEVGICAAEKEAWDAFALANGGAGAGVALAAAGAPSPSAAAASGKEGGDDEGAEPAPPADPTAALVDALRIVRETHGVVPGGPQLSSTAMGVLACADDPEVSRRGGGAGAVETRWCRWWQFALQGWASAPPP